MLKKISNKEYQSIPAISHSLLVAIRKKGYLPAFLTSAFNPDRKDETKDCFDLGNAYHTLISCPEVLEHFEEYKTAWERGIQDKDFYLCIDLPETKWYIYDFGTRRTNVAYTKFATKIAMSGDDLILNWEEFELACSMATKMRENPLFQYFNSQEVIGFEVSIFRDVALYGRTTQFRIRPDMLVKLADGSYVIIDFKSTKAVSYEEMENVGEKEGYDIQAKDYIDRVSEEFEVPKDKVRFICLLQSKEFPELIKAFEFNSDSLVEAETDIYELSSGFLERYERYKEGDSFAFLYVTNLDNPELHLDIEIHNFKHWERRIKQDLKEEV